MKENITYLEFKEQYYNKLNQFVPVVARVHGPSHPEFYEVKRVWEEMDLKIKKEELNFPNLDKEFNKLKEITNNYLVPNDVCETYEWVYDVLKLANNIYNNEN